MTSEEEEEKEEEEEGKEEEEEEYDEEEHEEVEMGEPWGGWWGRDIPRCHRVPPVSSHRRPTTSCPTSTMGRALALTVMIMATRQCTNPENGYPQEQAPPGCEDPLRVVALLQQRGHPESGDSPTALGQQGSLASPPGQWGPPHPCPS